MSISVSGQREPREVTELARRQVRERLQMVHGVGAVFMQGGQTRAVNVVINTDLLASYQLSIEDVRSELLS